MLNVISILFGLFALVIALPGFVPFFGWLNWFVLPIAAVGLIVGVMSRSTAGRNFNIVVLVICTLRLMLGGGFF